MVTDSDALADHRIPAALAARGAGLAVATGAAIALGGWAGWLAVAAVALAAAATERWARVPGPVIQLAEAVAIAVVAALPATQGVPALAYLLVPPLAAGLRFGYAWAVRVSTAQLFAAVVAALVGGSSPWLVLCLVATGLVLGVIGASVGRAVAATMAELVAASAHEERRRLARDLHDGVAQDLAVLGFRVDQLLFDDHDRIEPAEVAHLADEVRRILQVVRWSVHDLRAGEVSEVGLGSALADHVRRAADHAGMAAHVSLDDAAERVPPAVQTELLRIGQEAVTNARKHSNARNLWVDVTAVRGGVRLQVSDDGCGGPSQVPGCGAPEGFGLGIMRERAASIGAQFAVHARPGGGTVVEVRYHPGDRPRLAIATDPDLARPGPLVRGFGGYRARRGARITSEVA